MPLIQLIYTSTSSEPPGEEELAAILDVSIRRNLEAGITGMLLYHGRRFLQVLEGPQAAVDATYARIAADPRHRDVCLIERAPILRRSFGDWSMGLRRLPDLSGSDHPGLNDVLRQGFSHIDIVGDPNLARSILQRFVRDSA